MKRVIGGVAYNTDTATVIGRVSYDDTSGHGSRGTQTLYQTAGGAFFLHSHEFITRKRRRGWQEREEHEILPITRDEAAEWPTNGAEWPTSRVEILADVFGEALETTEADSAGTSAVVNVRLPASLKERIDAAAKAKGLSVNSYAIRCFEQCLGSAVA